MSESIDGVGVKYRLLFVRLTSEMKLKNESKDDGSATSFYLNKPCYFLTRRRFIKTIKYLNSFIPIRYYPIQFLF
jgi:hypothetical protein